MLLVIGFVFRYFWWWHLQISFNCSSNLVWSWSSPSSQFVEFNGIVRHFGGISIAKSMFSLDSSVGFHGNASPCMKHVELLLHKSETSWFIFESTPFKYIISFSISFIVSPQFLSYVDLISCFILVYCCATRPLSSSCRFFEISSI